MANVIYGDDAIFDAMLYPEQNVGNVAWINAQFNNLSQTLTESGRRFMDTCRDISQNIQNSDIMRRVQIALRQSGSHNNPDQIRYLKTLEDIRAATGPMVRYNMAMPDIRELYYKDRCHGYGENYVDINPKAMRDEDYNYRRVMDGVFHEDNGHMVYKHYYELLHEGDRNLTHFEKFDVINTWDMMRHFVSRGVDPTDPYEGEL